jgi:hypothetical protein
MCEELVEMGELTLRPQTITRRRGPMFNPADDFESQGLFLWSDFTIAWELR